MNRALLAFPTGRGTELIFNYDTVFSEHSTFRRVKVGKTHSELVVDLKGLLAYISAPAYGWSTIAPDGSDLFVRDLSTDELYSLDLEWP